MEKFLEELTNLSLKYNLFINGCGCCGSPWLEDKAESAIGEHLYFNKDENKYKLI